MRPFIALLTIALAACPSPLPDSGVPAPAPIAPAVIGEKEQFIEDLRQALRFSQPGVTVAYDSQSDELGVGEHRVALGNIYAASRQSKEERSKAIETVVDMLLAAKDGPAGYFPSTFEAARYRLRPRIRDLASGDVARLQLNSLDGGVYRAVDRKLAGRLRIALVIDDRGSMADVPGWVLDQWGVTADQAFEVAIKNLERLPARFVAADGGLFISGNGDSYDASRMLRTDLVAKLGVAGRPVAFACARDALFIAGADDEASLIAALELCRETEPGYPISVGPVVLRDGAWSKYSDPKKIAFNALLAEAVAREDLDLLVLVSRELDAHFRRRQEDVFVATPLLVTVKGKQRTISTWAQGVRSVLPVSDDIAFAGVTAAGTTSRIAHFEDVKRVLGARMKPVPGLEPPWYEVDFWPTEAELRAMKAVPAGALSRSEGR